MRTDIPGLYGCIPRSSLVNVEVLVYLGGYDDRFEVVASSEQCPEGESDGFHTIGPNEAVDRPWGIDVSSVEVRGGTGDDVIRGGPAAVNEILGESGNDDVETFVRDDDVDGGSGNDTLDLGAGNDTGVGGTGTSTGGFLVPVRCPAQAGVRCTGTLTLRVPGTSVVLGQTSYDLAVGQEVSFGFQISGALPATVVASTSEQGQTQPRSASVSLGVS